MIDAETIFRPTVHGPAGQGETNLPRKARERRTRWYDDSPAGFRASAETLEPAQRTAQRLVHSADLVDTAVLEHGNARICQQAGDFLALAQHVALDYGHHLVSQGPADQGEK